MDSVRIRISAPSGRLRLRRWAAGSRFHVKHENRSSVWRHRRRPREAYFRPGTDIHSALIMSVPVRSPPGTNLPQTTSVSRETCAPRDSRGSLVRCRYRKDGNRGMHSRSTPPLVSGCSPDRRRANTARRGTRRTSKLHDLGASLSTLPTRGALYAHALGHLTPGAATAALTAPTASTRCQRFRPAAGES